MIADILLFVVLPVVFGLIVSVPLIVYMYRWEDYLETMDDGLSTAEIFHKAGEGKW